MTDDIITCAVFSCDWFYKHPDLEVRKSAEAEHWREYHEPKKEDET